jgi:hypothetical protein
MVMPSTSTVISTDPTATIANRITAPSAGNYADTMFASGTSGQWTLNYPLKAGENIFISVAGTSKLMLFFADPS